jgi:hypothetical protein
LEDGGKYTIFRLYLLRQYENKKAHKTFILGSFVEEEQQILSKGWYFIEKDLSKLHLNIIVFAFSKAFVIFF